MRTTGPAQPGQFLLDVPDLLSQLGVRYAVVGAFGAAYYGVPRATADADAVVWLQGTGNSEQDVKYCESSPPGMVRKFSAAWKCF